MSGEESCDCQRVLQTDSLCATYCAKSPTPPPLMHINRLQNKSGVGREHVITHCIHRNIKPFSCGTATGLLRQLCRLQNCRFVYAIKICATAADSHPLNITMNVAAQRFNAQRQDTLLGVFHSTLHASEGGLRSAPAGKPEQEHISVLKLVFQHWNVELLGSSSKCITETWFLGWSTIQFCG